MILREFTPAGIEAFRNFLSTAREEPATALPTELLEDERLTTVIAPKIELEPRQFVTKGDAAIYLTEKLALLSPDAIANSAGLWTWMTLYFFDQVCPATDGRRLVRNSYHYIFEPKNSRHFYRHLLFIAWRIQNVAPSHNRLMLSSSISTLDKATSEVMKRLYLTRIPCIFEVLDRLYWDEERGRIRLGVVGQVVRAGDLMHRFPLRIRQLEMTYDLQSLNADQLIDLLGDEFQRDESAVHARAN